MYVIRFLLIKKKKTKNVFIVSGKVYIINNKYCNNILYKTLSNKNGSFQALYTKQ